MQPCFEWRRAEEPAPAPAPAAPTLGANTKGSKGRRGYTPLDLGPPPPLAACTSAGTKFAPWFQAGSAGCELPFVGKSGPLESGPENTLNKADVAICSRHASGASSTFCETEEQKESNDTFHVPTRVQVGQILNPEANQEFICRICLDLCDDPAVLPCSHLFCRACIQMLVNWKGALRVQCPACRADFSKEQVAQGDLKGSEIEAGIIRRCIDGIQICCAFCEPSRLADAADDPLAPDHAARKLELICPWIGPAGAYAKHAQESCQVAACLRQLARAQARPTAGPNAASTGECFAVLQQETQVNTSEGRLTVSRGTPCLVHSGRGDSEKGIQEVLLTVLWLEGHRPPVQGWASTAAFVPSQGETLRTRRACETLVGTEGYLSLSKGEDVHALHFEWDEGTRVPWFYGHTGGPANKTWGWLAVDVIQWQLGPERAKQPASG